MPYVSAQDIKNDALFRAGEIPGSSEWDIPAMAYLNRVYRALCIGASEFLPEYVDDWWWMRAKATLMLDPVITGSVSATQNNSVITFSVDPGVNLVGWRFRVKECPDVFLIATHTGVNATLDTPYTGDTAPALEYQVMHVTYNLNAAVASIISPIASFRENPQIMGLAPERMDTLFPLQNFAGGVPQAFALENEQQIRFSHGGLTDGKRMRMEYWYKPMVADLFDSSSSIPLVPLQFRHILSDMTLTYIYLDKNDDRATSVMGAARVVLQAMIRENRRRNVKMDNSSGMIFPRQNQTNRNRLLRTESGLIIR